MKYLNILIALIFTSCASQSKLEITAVCDCPYVDSCDLFLFKPRGLVQLLPYEGSTEKLDHTKPAEITTASKNQVVGLNHECVYFLIQTDSLGHIIGEYITDHQIQGRWEG